MTNPNLDKLAALAPFTTAGKWGGYEFFDCDGRELDHDDIAAALNEWAELRAYKQRTEELIHHVWAWFDDHDDRMASFELHRMLKGAVDPAPKEAK